MNMDFMNNAENDSSNEFLFDLLNRSDSDDLNLCSLEPRINDFPICGSGSDVEPTKMRPKKKVKSLTNETVCSATNYDSDYRVHSTFGTFNLEKEGLISSSACGFDDPQDFTAQIYPSPISSVIDLDNQELIGPIMNANDIDFNFFENNFTDELSQANQLETENKQLINNIENMIQSMDESNQLNIIEKYEVKNPKEADKYHYKRITPKIIANKIGPIDEQSLSLNGMNMIRPGNRLPLQPQPILIGNLNALTGNNSISGSSQIQTNYEILSVHTSPTVKVSNLPKTSLILSPLVVNNDQNANNVLSQPNNIDVNLFKKHSRMIKNRESACLSRKRKKEYIQNLEESLKQIKEQNNTMNLENQELKEKNLVLETENKFLKEQLINKTKIEQNHVNAVKLKGQHSHQDSRLGASSNGSNSFKRPFVMMAVFFVFGLNILQFINISDISLKNDIEDYRAKTQFELIDPQNEQSIKSRHLLSDYDYPNDSNEATPNKQNLTANSESLMDLILINGTWHLVDITICYKLGPIVRNESGTFYNTSHINKMNSELNRWFERHSKRLRRKLSFSEWHESFFPALWREFKKEKQKKFGSKASSSLKKTKLHPERFKARDKRKSLKKLDDRSSEFPVSLYHTQSRLHENFARRIRTNKSTFYYVSFKRDYIVMPAIIQSSKKRPKLSIVVPTTSLVSNRFNASNQKKKGIGFIQIDCEVLDTKSLYFNIDEIPYVYMKILEESEI